MRVDASKPIYIQDLGITVGPGPAWIESEDFKKSTCLQALIRLGEVQVSSSPRCRVSQDPPKKPPVHTVGMSRPNKVARHHITHKTEVIKEVIKEGINPEQARDMVSKAAKEASEAAVAAVLGLLPQGEGLGDIDIRIEQALTRVLGSVKMAPSGVAEDLVFNGPEDPLFIPTGIVRADTESLNVQSDSSADVEGLDDAASALKALRKSKK
jgi:hypothetical protein